MRERVKRLPIERTTPIRNWSTLFAPPGPAATPVGFGRPPTGKHDGAASLSDAVSRSVDLAYRVVDEYIRQGQKAAQRLSGGTYGPQALTTDAQQLSARMAQYAAEFFALWFEVMGLAAAGGLPRDAAGSGGGPRASAAGTAPDDPPATTGAARAGAAEGPERTRVKIEVISPYPTEVSLDLRPEAMRSLLVVHALRAVDPEKPRIDEVSFRRGTEAADDEPETLRIRVPENQPAGTYNALILDEQTTRPVGTLSVRIFRA